MSEDPLKLLSTLSTPHLADACLRVGVAVRCGPAGLIPLATGMHCVGRALPARHVGSVDVFFEALERSRPRDVLVIDNLGRLDEACIGDLVTLEAQKAGLSGIVVWGLHRDTDELLAIGLPFFSLGRSPVGPQRLDPRSADDLTSVHIGPWNVTSQDIVIGDSDGVLLVPMENLGDIAAAAIEVRDTERGQAANMQAGVSFRQQVGFAKYLAARNSNPALSFREHLRTIGAAIEE
jgi:4-hydroxy-4-methyl-2-oxoglutarate aldolase